MIDETVQPDSEDRITRERREHAMMKAALTQIASMTDPDDMEVDDEGITDWGVGHEEAVAMAYENAITIAQIALGELS